MKLPKLTRRRFLRLAAGSGALLAADAFFIEPTALATRVVRLGPGAPTHRIVLFSDTHHKGNRAYLETVIGKINALAPDFVCFVGDLIEKAEYLPEALEVLQTIKTPLYGVPGNHDYESKADFAVIAKAFAATGGRWLLNENIILAGGQINLIGAICDRPDLVQPQSGVKNILLMHYPAWAEKLTDKKFDAILAGHSHGGQVRIPFYGAPYLPIGVGPYQMGLYQTPSGPLYVNPGIGWFILDVRFNCPPEITVIEI